MSARPQVKTFLYDHDFERYKQLLAAVLRSQSDAAELKELLGDNSKIREFQEFLATKLPLAVQVLSLSFAKGKGGMGTQMKVKVGNITTEDIIVFACLSVKSANWASPVVSFIIPAGGTEVVVFDCPIHRHQLLNLEIKIKVLVDGLTEVEVKHVFETL